MLWITCPTCGDRPVSEFRYGGELPHVPERITDDAQRNVDWVWMHDNVEGIATERWFHAAGCRRWLTLHRDTRTDQVVA